MIASTMVRASAKGLPLRPVGRGSMSAIIDHWASESTWNLDIWPVSQDGRYIFVRHALVDFDLINCPLFYIRDAFADVTELVNALPFLDELSAGHLNLLTHQERIYGVPFLGDY